MKKVKVIGAGSIGNHLSHASRSLGWYVDLCDRDSAALERTQTSIYPGRYGAWDEAINLYTMDDVPVGGYDLILVGTAPESHIPLALAALEESPKAILIEKPLCSPDLKGMFELWESAQQKNIPVFVGYDHVVSLAAEKVTELMSSQCLGAVETLDVEFREFWGGIFKAHPWLEGPHDSYLGYWQRGGGASGEHSHAMNLWQYFAHALQKGRVVEVNATLEYYRDDRVDYDKLCLANLKTEHGLVGRVVQDVVTHPPRKWARLQGNSGYIEWHCGYQPGHDAVLYGHDDQEKTHLIKKSRPDDFIKELKHIETALLEDPDRSPIALMRGMETMLVVAAVHESAKQGRAIQLDYSLLGSKEAIA